MTLRAAIAIAVASLATIGAPGTSARAAPTARAIAGATTADPPDVRVPPGTRRDATGALVSSRGLRETTDFLVKELDHRGLAVDRIGPERVRGIELTRLVSQTPTTPWLAIHVMRSAGKTVIFFVPRPAS